MPVHDWTKVEDGIFHSFHTWWLVGLCDVLNGGVLPESFYALPEQDAGPGIPDVVALQRQDHANGSNGAGGTALSVVAPKVRFRDRAERKRKLQPRQRRIAIRHVSGDGIVAFIEIVSPGNKSSRRAIRKFVQKSTAFIEQEIHLLVLDLFPPGGLDPRGLHPLIWAPFHRTDFHLPRDKPLTLAAYNAAIPEAFVEPVAVGDRLPKMPLFLSEDDYVNVPLEASYQAAWSKVPKRWRDAMPSPTRKTSHGRGS